MHKNVDECPGTRYFLLIAEIEVPNEYALIERISIKIQLLSNDLLKNAMHKVLFSYTAFIYFIYVYRYELLNKHLLTQ